MKRRWVVLQDGPGEFQTVALRVCQTEAGAVKFLEDAEREHKRTGQATFMDRQTGTLVVWIAVQPGTKGDDCRWVWRIEKVESEI